MKGFVIGVGSLAALALLGLVGYYGGIIGNRVQANYNKRVVTSKIQQNVRTPSFAQPVYEGFFNLCAAVQTDEASLEAQYEQLAATTDPADRDRIQTNIAGLKANRAEAINQYNADGAEYTRGQFLASNLPSRLDGVTSYTKGTHTTCAA